MDRKISPQSPTVNVLLEQKDTQLLLSSRTLSWGGKLAERHLLDALGTKGNADLADVARALLNQRGQRHGDAPMWRIRSHWDPAERLAVAIRVHVRSELLRGTSLTAGQVRSPSPGQLDDIPLGPIAELSRQVEEKERQVAPTSARPLPAEERGRLPPRAATREELAPRAAARALKLGDDFSR